MFTHFDILIEISFPLGPLLQVVALLLNYGTLCFNLFLCTL